jgi:hypothetical protein
MIAIDAIRAGRDIRDSDRRQFAGLGRDERTRMSNVGRILKRQHVRISVNGELRPLGHQKVNCLAAGRTCTDNGSRYD